MGRHILFKCPRTGLKVQHWLDDVPDGQPEASYQSVNCPSCSWAHFINRRTGRLLGEPEK